MSSKASVPIFLRPFLPFSPVYEFANEGMIGQMSAAIGYDSTTDGSAQEHDIAEQISYFMAGTFPVETKFVFDRPVIPDNENIFGGKMAANSPGLKRFGFGLPREKFARMKFRERNFPHQSGNPKPVCR